MGKLVIIENIGQLLCNFEKQIIAFTLHQKNTLSGDVSNLQPLGSGYDNEMDNEVVKYFTKKLFT